MEVDRKACGLVFLDASDHIVGCLSLPSGISALPLMMVDSGVPQVDLGDTTILDSVATHAHDPVAAGGEAQKTAEELAAYRLQSSLFSAIVRNLDMNHDGTLDVPSSRPHWIDFGADFDGGLTAPGGSTFTLHEATPYTYYRDGQPRGTATTYHWVLRNTSWGAFQAGTYAITLDGGGPVSFDVADPLSASNCIVATRFWYETPVDRITRAHWEWEMLDGRPSDATSLLQPHAVLQFGYDVSSQVTYGRVASADTSHAVDTDPTGLQGLGLFATDLFGNTLATNYRFQ